MIQWQWSHFDQLSTQELYQVLRLRQAVFAVEQDCVYQDCDNADQQCWHLIGWSTAPAGELPATEDTLTGRCIAAYLRVVPAGMKYPEIAIGRVVIADHARSKGYGKQLMEQGILQIERQWPKSAIRISAQAHLQKFYGELGFECVSPPYQEDGIPHVEMLRSPQSQKSS
ncbi:MAG: GNAT family N-acetyltransferase [Cellvibrionaceae bacterium]